LTFGKRFAGNSKASVAEARRYLVHLGKLRLEGAARFARFGTVGLTGLVVNMALLALFTSVGGIYYLLSAFLATQGSTLWNFALTEAWVFRGREHRHSGRRRLALFFIVNNVALVLRAPILFVLTSVLGMHYLLSNFISLAALTVARYVLADSWIWAKGQLVGANDIRKQTEVTLENLKAAVTAAGALVQYLHDTQKAELAHVRDISFRSGRQMTAAQLTEIERQLATKGTCGLTVPVFDGRYRYDLVFTDAGKPSLSPEGGQRWQGTTIACRMASHNRGPADPEQSEGAKERDVLVCPTSRRGRRSAGADATRNSDRYR
jgi:putative flippase GtrA